MENSKQTLHFSLGENMGIILAEIAQDHILSGNGEKAKQLYKESLMGINDLQVRNLLTGEYVLEVTDDQQLEMVKYNPETHKGYPHPDYLQWLKWKDKYLKETYKHLMPAVRFCVNRPIKDYVATLYREDWEGLVHEVGLTSNIQLPEYVSSVTVTLSTRDILNIVVSGKKKEFLDMLRLKDQENDEYLSINGIASTLYYLQSLVKDCEEIQKVESFLDKNLNVRLEEHEFNRREALTYVNKVFTALDCGRMSEDLQEEFGHQDIEEYTKSIQELGEMLRDNKFHPISPSNHKDAVWISPEGEYFGANGDYAAMIHEALAEKICEYKGYTPDDEGENRCYWYLERLGYMKIHFSSVNWSGINPLNDEDRTHITKEQVQAVAEHFKSKELYSFTVGYNKIITVPLWVSMDDLAREKLLGI